MLGELLPCGGGRPIPLLKPKLVVGRQRQCDISLPFTTVSSRHSEMEYRQGCWHVRDLGSKNGTYVNGRKVGADLQNASTRIGHNVLDGELITVGGTTLSVEIVDCPHAGNGTEGNTGWQNGETLKVDCPLPC